MGTSKLELTQTNQSVKLLLDSQGEIKEISFQESNSYSNKLFPDFIWMTTTHRLNGETEKNTVIERKPFSRSENKSGEFRKAVEEFRKVFRKERRDNFDWHDRI